MRKIRHSLAREDSDYLAQCLDFAVSSFGETKKEALRVPEEAIELYLPKSSKTSVNNFSVT